MPIRPERRHLYGPEWKAISRARRERAGWRCEWCSAEHGQPHPISGSKVVLTTAHLDHDPSNLAPGNLATICMRCQLRYDAQHHAKTRRETLRRRTATCDLFGPVHGDLR